MARTPDDIYDSMLLDAFRQHCMRSESERTFSTVARNQADAIDIVLLMEVRSKKHKVCIIWWMLFRQEHTMLRWTAEHTVLRTLITAVRFRRTVRGRD